MDQDIQLQVLIETLQTSINRVEDAQKETKTALIEVQRGQEETRLALLKNSFSQQQTESNVSTLSTNVEFLTKELRMMQRADDKQAGKDEYIREIKKDIIRPVTVALITSIVALLINLVWLFIGGKH